MTVELHIGLAITQFTIGAAIGFIFGFIRGWSKFVFAVLFLGFCILTIAVLGQSMATGSVSTDLGGTVATMLGTFVGLSAGEFAAKEALY